MSLKVWLPLNGDLHNLGISEVSITNNGATINANGKIGSCYSFNGTDQYLNFNDFDPSGWPEMSIAFWFYSDGTDNSFFLLRRNGLHAFRLNGAGVGFRDTKNTSTLRTANWTETLPINTWTHLVAIYNRGQIMLYKNGVLDTNNNTYYHEDGTLYTSTLNSVRIGRIQSSSSNTYYSGKINDFRIYDHALSAAEVREISLGLVLHYKLNSLYQNLSPNNITTWTNCSVNQFYGTIFSINMSDFINQTKAKNGDKFTFSVDIKAASNNKVLAARVQHYNSSSDRNSVLGNNIEIGEEGRSYVTFTINTAYTRLDFMITNVNQTTGTSTEQYKCTLIEYGETASPWISNTLVSIILDSSGYNHNGNLVNTTLSSDSPRYSHCISCLGADINTNTITGAQFFYCNMEMPAMNAITVTWWGKNIAYSRGGIFETSNIVQTNTSKGSDHSSTAFANWDTTFGIYNGTNRVNIYSNFVKDGNWHHHAITFDGANAKYYCDGILKQTGALTGTLPAWKSFCMGLGKAGSVWRLIQLHISDLRIYCTALSSDDILSLYHTAAKADNLGELHTFEFLEIGPVKIYKTGITLCQEISEINGIEPSTITKITENNIILAKQMIER